jgi:hypothetical protein
VAIGLGAFVVVTAIVVWRRSVGVATAREMRTMETERRMLASQKESLEHARRTAVSRATVIREAEQRLGLHVAGEAQTRSLGSLPADAASAR